MIEGVMKGLIQGLTLIEDSTGSMGSIFAKQIGSLACTLEKKVILLTTEDEGATYASLELNNFSPKIVVEELASASLAHKSEEFDVIIIDSFSVFLFDKTEAQIVGIIDDMKEYTRKGKCFVLTHDCDMVSTRVNAFLRQVADSYVVVRTEFAGNKINRMLYIPKVKSERPLAKLLKVTLENDGVQVDTRELIG